MARPGGTLAAMDRFTASSKRIVAEDLKPVVMSVRGYSRRGLLTILLSMPATAATNASDSKTALLQEYIKRSKENKAKNDKERLDDYYKRNYKDYFELFEGSVQGKKDEELSETEKAIREWLQKNK